MRRFFTSSVVRSTADEAAAGGMKDPPQPTSGAAAAAAGGGAMGTTPSSTGAMGRTTSTGSIAPHQGAWTANQAKMERTIANHSRSFGEGVQTIVATAKAKGTDDWKTALLDLLGQNNAKSDIDILIAHHAATHFCRICLEHELPPNLVHCLRLLRVLELQNASLHATDATPLSIVATNKVSRLLILLCKTDTAVGDQLRPHLFGLFALSGASYPKSGIHVAAAAAAVIAQYPLTANTVWFIHDRKMLIHMTDDVKELAAASEQEPAQNETTATVPCGLTGQDAEEAGLLVIALSTVVKLVYESLKFKTVDLVKDFTVASGFQIMEHCVMTATGANGKAMLELLPMLACCPPEILVDSENEPVHKLACNNYVLEMFADLLTRSNPMLRRKRSEDKDIWRELINLQQIDNLRELVGEAMDSAGMLRLGEARMDPDLDLHYPLSADFLGIVLQLFADHPSNYTTMELRMHILTFSMVAFPCFRDTDAKIMIMKTLELVMTSVGPTEEMTPVYACIEVFFALADATLKAEADPKLLECFAADAELMGTTLEKLLEFDQRVAPLFVDSGLWDERLSSFLQALSALPENNELPPVKTPQDKTLSRVCRVLRLLVANQPVDPSKSQSQNQLGQLLQISVRKMGIAAVVESARVYETFMSSYRTRKQLDENMRFALSQQRFLCDLVLRYPRNPLLLKRVSALISMLRSVLEEKRISRESFRLCEGFDLFLSTFLCMKNISKSFELPDFPEIVWELLQNLFGLLDAAIGMKARNSLQANEIYPLSIHGDVCVDCISSQLSSESTSSVNRNFLREKGFYLDLAAAIAAMGLLENNTAQKIITLAKAHMDPEIEVSSDSKNLRNPDAARLILGLCAFMPNARSGNDLATNTVDEILRLCEPDMAASSLSDLSSCGLCLSLTNPNEFGPILYDADHSLKSRFLRLLTLVAAQNMSYMEFVSLLRNVAGPMLATEDGTVRLPVISSSVRKQAAVMLRSLDAMSDESSRREDEYSARLGTICEIAQKADRFPRISLGGDSINTIAVLMHEVRLEERLKAAAEESKLRFLEIESIDASVSSSLEENGDAPTTETMWTPLVASGFTFSLWMRHAVPIGSGSSGNLHILDMFNVSGGAGAGSSEYSFLSIWYDLQNQRFNVMSSASYRGEPTCFPVSPLTPDAWHHVMITYTPAKRSMIARKSAFSVYVDGRPLEAEVRVESVNLPPSAKVVIGAPNPALAMGGVVRGVLPVWELGPSLMLATVLLDLDATSIYAYGPSFPALLWGDRPQRLSLAATATSMFSMLAETGEAGSVASALRRRDIARLENAGIGSMVNAHRDDLATANLLCNLPPDCVVFGFHASTINSRMRNEAVQKKRSLRTKRLVNVARLNFASDIVSTDAVVYGRNSVIAPTSFMDCLRWVAGPQVLMPLVNAATSAKTLRLALQLIRLGCKSHRPNLEMLQAGGGHRILSVLLQGKGVVHEHCLDQCFAFAVHGFEPAQTAGDPADLPLEQFRHWVFSDLDAMKHLLLNHQVWELRKYGPTIPTRLLSYLNLLVHHSAVHKAFNARRLHQLGIVQWTLHLAIEAAELYAASDNISSNGESTRQQNSLWYSEYPDVAVVSVGGDPGNAFLLECKTLLRRVLTFMLTPKDLESLVECIMYSANIGTDGTGGKVTRRGAFSPERRMIPSATLRLHLVRLLEELMVDGVNEIVAAGRPDGGEFVQSHAGGVASFGQPYFTSAFNRGKTSDGKPHPKHQQAQNFLSAFAAYLTPVWFASVLEGCQEEASASALVRLMILMVQGSASFEDSFREAGSFTPFVLSVPRYSTCPGIATSLLSQLLSVPILHLHSLPSLNPDQLCEVFDTESIEADYDLSFKRDPASGVFALLVECIGRNVQIASEGLDDASTAMSTNEAIVHLLVHRHGVSQSFRIFCHSVMFLEPLSQALCLLYREDSQTLRRNRTPMLADIPKGLSPTERFIGSIEDPDSTGMGIVRLIRLIVSDAVNTCARAATIVYSIFRSFPIHASPEQVAAFHLVLLEHCCAVIDTVLQGSTADAMVISNCIGICSVFVDHQIGAFFTSEAAMKTVTVTIAILNALLRFETPAIYSMSNSEHSMLTRDASYIASLACVAALRIGMPATPAERGDEDLQAMVLDIMNDNISSLLLLPSRDRKSNWKIPTGKAVKPSQNSRMFDVWVSASITRCVTERNLFFPDYFTAKDPEVVTIAPMLGSLHRLLVGSRDDVRSLAVSLFVALLEHRSNLLGELLITEVKRNGKAETIDIVSRGGFKALLAAHEAASADRNGGKTVNVARKYSTFFDWFDRCQDEVQLVFTALEKKARDVCPGLQETASSQEETVENEQKLMLMRLTEESSDRTMIGGLERAELASFCMEKTAELHSQWKRQGFDHLAYGAMKWKFLLRQLKGSSSVWEGGPMATKLKAVTFEERISSIENKVPLSDEPSNQVKRWKLDLTEGSERQRRRLLPNYEFHGLYNLEEEHDVDMGAEVGLADVRSEATEVEIASEFLVSGGEMEATAALLKDLNIKRTHRQNDDDDFDRNDETVQSDSTTVASTASGLSDGSVGPDADSNVGSSQLDLKDEDDAEETIKDEKDSSSYELITGLLRAGDWPVKSYNVQRCTGLEVTKALLLWCGSAMYVIDGFEQTGDDGMEGKITRVERERTSFHINLRPKNFKVKGEGEKDDHVASAGKHAGSILPSRKGKSLQEGPDASVDNIIYEHRSQRILLTDLHSVYRRRYQLQQTGLEFFDINRNSALIAFSSHADREEVLTKVLHSHIPNSIFGASLGSFISYTKFMQNRKAKIMVQWQTGKMTNFEYLMELNSLAGRSFNDLTAYPVFPWVIADYESEKLDLNDPSTYRDLSKPMGAIGPQRANQFRERYEALASTYFGEDDPPPFHYGTHYSCAAYVLYYLMRLEPFSRLALSLQGGRFDVADRLFHDVGRSWRSASCENLQDVRELIPEFYYLPDFLVNTNHFDFGETQRGKTVHDVTLPRWAKDDPKRFVRINRQALESEYVSKNLHLWLDLVFGHKQRGDEAIACLNTFVHVTYEGEVDIDSMTNPVQRQSTIAQIQNFGQTPSRLERRPFPQRTLVSIVKENAIDFSSVAALTHLTPPLCVVGAPSRIRLSHVKTEQCRIGRVGVSDTAVGEISYSKGQLLAVPKLCALAIPMKKYFSFGGVNNGVTVHAAAITARFREVNKLLSIHDDMHRAPIVAAKASLNGDWLVTGSVDSTIRVWFYDGTQLNLQATFCGHDGSRITCIDVSVECGVIVSGCSHGRVLLWDLRTLTFVRALQTKCDKATLSASINHKNGNVVALVDDKVLTFDINGTLVAERQFSSANPPTCAAATDCPEWMEEGIAVVTGHHSGEVRLFSIDYDQQELVHRHTVESNPHTSAITALRVTGAERQDTLLVGDASGSISVFHCAQLDSFTMAELDVIAKEITTARNAYLFKNGERIDS